MGGNYPNPPNLATFWHTDFFKIGATYLKNLQCNNPTVKNSLIFPLFIKVRIIEILS